MEPHQKREGSVAPPGGVVLGLDPGSRRTGFGLLRSGSEGICRISSGVFALDASKPFVERLPQLRRELLSVIEAYQPDQAALETCFVARSARSALVLGHVRGVLLLLCLEAGMNVYEYSPSEVKRAVTGSGGASKQQVQTMLAHLILGLPQRPSQDEADALATAYCHINRSTVVSKRPLLGVS
jgi:crossover junction endodeoxyribonuclease RuvC